MLSKSLGDDYHCHSNFGNTFCFGHTFLLFDIDFIGVKRCKMENKSEFQLQLITKNNKSIP